MAILPFPNVWKFVGLYAAFWIVAGFSDYHILSTGIYCLTLSVAILVLWTYRKESVAALLAHYTDQEDHLVLGIACAWTGVLLRSGLLMLWRFGAFGNEPTDPLSSPWIVSFNFMIILGGVLHALAPGTKRSVIPSINWAQVFAALMVGCMLWGGFLALRLPF